MLEVHTTPAADKTKGAPARLSIVVAVCTYNRNGPLTTLLDALLACVKHLAGKTAVGVVIVDDSKDGQAHSVADRFKDQFELGVTYRISGRQNISLARNIAIETASGIADWVAMTDDDCEPPKEWLAELLRVQQDSGADAVTGRLIRRVPAGSPQWLTEEPFLELGMDNIEDGAEVTTAATFNTMISSQWLKDHSAVRFQTSLGVVGGEDMVFFRAARAQGLKIHFSQRGFVFENEPPSRATWMYQLRLFFWHGNSSYVSSVQSGASPVRMFIHGANSFLKALMRPVFRGIRGETLQLRYSLALALHAVGKLIGPFGVRVKHR